MKNLSVTLISHSVLHKGTYVYIPGVYNVVFRVHVFMFSRIAFQIDEHLGTFRSRSLEQVCVAESFIAFSYEVH